MKKITLETTMLVTKFAMSPIKCWPPPIGSSNSVIIRHNLCLSVLVLHSLFGLSATVLQIYRQRHDLIRVIKIVSEMCVMVSTVAKIIICKALIAEVEKFMKHATCEEKDVIQVYVDKCVLLHTFILISVILGPLAFILAPTVTSQPFPGDAAYAFSTEPYWVWYSVYISQSIIAAQAGCMVIADFMFAILLWYAGARFEMLSMDFRKVTNVNDVHRCVEIHQELIRYANELLVVTRIMALEVTMTAVAEVVVGGFVLIRHPTMYEVAKYVFYEIGVVTELFMFCWAANNLIETSEKIGDAIYNSDWIGKSPMMLKDLLIIIQRCRKPIIISVDGILPVLSLEFYGSSMAAAFSYLTTLRAMTEG